MDCLNPKGIANPVSGTSMRVRCGKCLPCKKVRAGEWTIRLKEHLKVSDQNWFITLTLSDENLTWSVDKPTLSKRDVQLFMKRLRKGWESRSLSYFAVGEYGERHKRPHYHLLLFNTGINNENAIYHIVHQIWAKGGIHVGQVNEASIKYVAGYMEKGLYGETDDTIQREFNLMSKGLGKEYITKTKNYHEKNEKFEYSIGGGEYTKLPRYFQDRIFTKEAREKRQLAIATAIQAKHPKEESDLRFANISRINSIRNLKQKRNE